MVNIGPPAHLIDNPHAPDVFATDALGFTVLGGNIAITFVTARASHVGDQSPVNHVVIGRLIMPALGAHQLAVGLFDFLKQHGFDAAQQPGAPPLQ